jgi:hypothetical protein
MQYTQYKPEYWSLREQAKHLSLQRTMTRGHAGAHTCPRCHAQPGQPCISARGRLRISNHLERVMNAAGWPV